MDTYIPMGFSTSGLLKGVQFIPLEARGGLWRGFIIPLIFIPVKDHLCFWLAGRLIMQLG